MRNSDPVIRVSIMVVCFGMGFGFGISSIAGVLETLVQTFALTTGAQEYLVAVLVVACFIGALLASPLSVRFGRKPPIFLAALLAGAGYIAIILVPSYPVLFAAWFVIGLSVGVSSMVVPMYAAEVTRTSQRGAVVSLFQLAITAGILLAYSVALFLLPAWPWSWVLSFGFVPALAGFVCMLTLPESPRWLLTMGRHHQSLAAVQSLGLGDEIIAATPVSPADRQASPGVWSAFSPAQRRRVLIVLIFCSFLFVAQNLSGIDGILYYAPHIFQTLGFSAGTASLAATFGLGLVNFLATIVALRLVDSAGRRPLLVYGCLFMVAGLGMVVVAAWCVMPWLGLVGLCMYILAFAVSLGPLPYVIMSELFPGAIRERGIAIASATSWLFNALIAFTFLSVTSAWGLPGTLMFFLLVCFITLVICSIFLPETRLVSLEQIEQNVVRGQPLRHLGQKSVL